jgi:hypothetical protein
MNTITARLFTVCAFAAALEGPLRAQIPNSISTHVAATCTVDEDSVSKYQTLGPELRFRGVETGVVTARCNVTNPRDDGQNPQWGVMEVAFRDPDGPGRNRVQVWLKRVTNNGGIATLASFDSNVSVPPLGRINFAHPFNFLGNAYYLEVKITRNGVTSFDNPSLILVRLTVPGPF